MSTVPALAVAFASAAGKPIDSHSPEVTSSAPAEWAWYILLLSSVSIQISPAETAVGTLVCLNVLLLVAPSSGKVVVNSLPLPTTWVEAILAFLTSASPNVVEPSAAFTLVPNLAPTVALSAGLVLLASLISSYSVLVFNNSVAVIWVEPSDLKISVPSLAPTVALSAGLVLLASWISSYSVFLLSNITSAGVPAVSCIVVVELPSKNSNLPVVALTLTARLFDNALPATVLVIGTLPAKSVDKSSILDCANIGILLVPNSPLPIFSAGNVGINPWVTAPINCVNVIFLFAPAVSS